MSSPARRRGRALAGLAVAVPLTLAMGLGAAAAPPDHASNDRAATADRAGPGRGNDEGNHGRPPELRARVKDVIRVKGREFKDLNANDRLDVYEDWHRSTEERVADLVSQMTLEEKAGLVLIDTLNAACDPETGERGTLPASASDYVNNQQMHRFVFRNVVATDAAECGAGGGGRSGTPVTPAEAATFTNGVQELSEATRLGIPALFKSNARNHIDPDARVGINEASGAFSAFPKEAGIAAAALGEEARRTGEEPTTGDMSVVEDFAEVMGDEWESVGLRGMYGYMADLSTEPRWYRTHETFTEDADLAANIMETLAGTLQGPMGRDGNSLSPESSPGRASPSPTRSSTACCVTSSASPATSTPTRASSTTAPGVWRRPPCPSGSPRRSTPAPTPSPASTTSR